MIKAELIFVPAPIRGHLVSAMEIARRFIDEDDRLSITVLVMNLPLNPANNMNPFTEYLGAASLPTRFRFIELPRDNIFGDIKDPNFFTRFIESHKPHVRNFLTEHTQSEHGPNSPSIAGFVLDMLCSSMTDVASEFGIPSYTFFSSGAAFLGFMLHLQSLQDDHGKEVAEFNELDAELDFPCLVNTLPAKVFPSVVLNKDRVGGTLGLARNFRKTKGIMINSSMELEPYALKSLSEDDTVPPVYPVGPLVNLKAEADGGELSDIMKWLDDQPPSSVVFLCFGSMGFWDEDQIKEIAHALERSGHRFLWSLRQAPPKGNENPNDALPEGFLDRTAGMGKVIGPAPQMTVLGHPAIGGFVSHCEWNSILESIWLGVPIAAWPLYAEQQFNAFEMVVELRMSEEIRMDFRREGWMESETVKAEEIERGIKHLMNMESKVRQKVKRMSEESKLSQVERGSSSLSRRRFIRDVFDNMAMA